MSAEVSVNLHQLQQLVEEVHKTQQAQTVRLADGVVAVVKPDPESSTPAVTRRGHNRKSTQPKAYSLEAAFGSVPTPPHLRGRDIDEIIREAKEEHAARVMRE